MSYQVLARKWRPGKFSELVGQEHVVNAISNALDNNRLHHAYLFTGTRGVGKTTIARIFARSLNCDKGMSSNPCGVCNSCKDIEQGNFVDLLEIDAASRTKVEDTRELLDNVQYRPTRGDYKVYLIDEVHMLSKHSFNALLKTLEEPPPHVKFLLATTDPQKLPITILSRCLQFNLKALTREQISGQLAYILKQENLPYDEAALALLAKSAQGSMRDALSLTDQAIAQGNGQVLSQVVSDMLGLIDNDKIARLTQAIIIKDKQQVFQLIDELALSGADFKSALAELMSVFHQVALTQFVPEVCKIETTQARQIFNWAKVIPPEQVQLLYQIALQGRKDIEWAQDTKMGFEMAALRMLAFMPEKVSSGLEQLKKAANEATETQIKAPMMAPAEPPENLIKPPSAEKKTLVEAETQAEPQVSSENKVVSEVSPEEDSTQANSLEQELSGIIKQAESLNPIQQSEPQALSESINEAASFNSANQEEGGASSSSPDYVDSDDNYADDYHYMSQMDAAESSVSVGHEVLAQSQPLSEESRQGSDAYQTTGQETDTGKANAEDVPVKAASISNTLSLLSLMDTLASAPEEGKDNKGSPTYGKQSSDVSESGNDLAKTKDPEITDISERSPTPEPDKERVVEQYQDDILDPEDARQTFQDDNQSTLPAEQPQVVANPEDEPHIFNPESLLHSQTETPEERDDEVQRAAQESEDVAAIDVEQDLAPWEDVESSQEPEERTSLADEAKTPLVPESETQEDVQSPDSPSPHFVIEPYEPENATAYNTHSSGPGDDNQVPSGLSEPDHHADGFRDAHVSDTDFGDADYSDIDYSDRASSQQDDNGYHGIVDVDEEEEEYHELFAGPIPKVSVDFEIPFKVSDKKVIKASQLDTWSQLIEQSGIGGLNKQLALHSNYVLQGDNVKLIVSEHQKHLFTDTALAAIEEALSETLQHDVNVSAHIGEVIDTPAAVQYAINNMRQEYAVKTIQQDSGVKALCEAFSGTVLNETIEPR
ncbi:DNA polymerase III subunit gamma/tau [Planctobacterium marinum]|uniref:DNA-directed DNA polymerase n=1 Tax=Planctobacterium marinum TaxID=1631968 RepID=A0AA48KR51_9ALTE|nr:DNA polymerase III subunit gamma/tau [Planctobacterium marinum]